MSPLTPLEDSEAEEARAAEVDAEVDEEEEEHLLRQEEHKVDQHHSTPKDAGHAVPKATDGATARSGTA